MRTAAPETMNAPRRTLRERLLSPGVLAVLTTALVAVAVGMGGQPADAASGTTYSGGANPTYTGRGAEPVTESVCGQYSSGVGACGFLTANADRFTISLPSGFVAQHQGTAADAVDNMAVVAAVVDDLNPAKYAPADQSVVPFDLSVSSSYASKLATVGVTPTQFPDWVFANVPANERAPSLPGSAFSAPAGGAAATSAPAPPPASSGAPAPSGGAASKTSTAPAAVLVRGDESGAGPWADPDGCRTAGRPAKGVAPTGRAARLRSNQAPGGDPEPRPAPPTCNGKPGPSPQPEHGTNVRSYAMEPDRLGDRLLPRPIRMQAVAAPQPYVGREP